MNLDLIGSIVGDEMDSLANDIIESQRSKGLRKTGRTADSVRQETVIEGDTVIGRVYGSELLIIQEKGRGPNRSGKPSRRMVEEIAEWVKIAGISISPWAIATKIARDGIKVPNRFNVGGVLSEPLDPERIKKKVRDRVKDTIFKSIKTTLFNQDASAPLF